MENRLPWTRRLGEAIASLNGEAHNEFLDIVMDMPVELRNSIITAYVISSLKNAKDRNRIITLLDLAKNAGLITVTRYASKNTPYFRFNNSACYVPTNSQDKRAHALLLAACRRNSELNPRKNNNTAKTENNAVHETVKPRVNSASKK